MSGELSCMPHKELSNIDMGCYNIMEHESLLLDFFHLLVSMANNGCSDTVYHPYIST